MKEKSTNTTNLPQNQSKHRVKIRAILLAFLYGDQAWARWRMIFLMAMVALTALLFVYFFEWLTLARLWHSLIFPLLVLNGILLLSAAIIRDALEADPSASNVVVRLLGIAVFVIFSTKLESMTLGTPLFTISRYLLAPLAALIGVILVGARYIQDIYNLESYGLALLYLLASFWGMVYPKLPISDGQTQIEANKVNRLLKIGGPGYLTIHPGNAVLLEHFYRSTEVYSIGTVFIPRFTSIASIVNLDDHHLSVSSVSTFTKDRIKVTVRDVRLRFRVWSGNQAVDAKSNRSVVNPYPYSIEAVRNKAYNLTVRPDGPAVWSDTVKGVVVGRIMDYVAEHQLDQITTPRYEEGDPREKIRRSLFEPAMQNKLEDCGAQLLWCDVGHFEVEDKIVLDQRLETWQAKWAGNANVVRAYGEAQRIAYQELGRAEAQAEMLMSIIHALDGIDLSKEKKDQNIRNVILIRTAQVLEALTVTKTVSKYKSASLPDNAASQKEEQSG